MAAVAPAAAFNFVDENMSGCLDAEEWRRFLNRFNSSVAVVNMRSMFLHLDKVIALYYKCPRTKRRSFRNQTTKEGRWRDLGWSDYAQGFDGFKKAEEMWYIIHLLLLYAGRH